MPIYRVEVYPRGQRGEFAADETLAERMRRAGLCALRRVLVSRLYLIEGRLDRGEAERIARGLLADPVTQTVLVAARDDEIAEPAGGIAVEVHPRPGVMDPVAESTRAELRAAGWAVESVRTARRYVFEGPRDPQVVVDAVAREIANDCIERIVVGSAGVRPGPRPPVTAFALRRVSICELDDAALAKLSRSAHLFLSLDEMRTIQAHFRRRGREPTDLEIETLAQTWSEHCVHKTLKAAVRYRGTPMGGPPDAPAVELRYDNLLGDTIARATRELIAARRGPECLSVFEDNAGVIGFDEDFGIALKVETHNHPSAIEPYGGAATGTGGCIRDIMGCGLGARPIANTDVFCVAPQNWPRDRLPKGVLHPRRVLEGVVRGVADYGNRMGIPTVNGAIHFDARYLGNPLVYCGCVGLIPRDRIHKAALPGDLVVVIGGRTGRDGIHGATFSSAELTDSHADEFSHAVQIGNAITEKRCLDALLRARDAAGGCLYHAVTDCGAGGLSSAVGEMAERVGALVDLDRVPLKYAGLRYDEIWISEAQERMVLAVAPENLERLMEVMRGEEVEATVIGTFGHGPPEAPRLEVRFEGQTVGELEMGFLHHGLPQRTLRAEWTAADAAPAAGPAPAVSAAEDLLALLASPSVAAREWVIRQYDHEVQGTSVIKPLAGPGNGPTDAAVLRPRLDGWRGIALGCGMAPQLADVDPYWAAAASIDEALRNVVCVGGDPRRAAMLDNFCWGRCDDPHRLGGLVRACQACYDTAIALGVPFVSGKDSLNNEFALHAEDIEPLLETIRALGEPALATAAERGAVLSGLAHRLRRTHRLAIPGTLLISTVALIDDVRCCVTPDFKEPGDTVVRVGGLDAVGFDMAEAARIHHAVAGAMRAGLVNACHDCSDGGWMVAIAEMVIAGRRGALLDELQDHDLRPAPGCAGYVLATSRPRALAAHCAEQGVSLRRLGVVADDDLLKWKDQAVAAGALRAAWGS